MLSQEQVEWYVKNKAPASELQENEQWQELAYKLLNGVPEGGVMAPPKHNNHMLA